MSRIKLLTWFAAILVPSLCVMSFPSVGQIACPAEGRPTLYGVACINAAKYLSFSPPSNVAPEYEGLAADIMALDHRAHNQLGPDTPEWTEVMGILTNAANFLDRPSAALKFYERAQQTFLGYLEAKNRIKYLLGLMIGVVVCTLLCGLLYSIARSLDQPFITPILLPLLCLFAGIGTLTSVLTRLDEIYLTNMTSTPLIMIDGGARPVVAVFFALVVYLILDLKVLDIKFGSPTANNQNSIYLVSSFLCGFSERFAQSILSKVMPAFGGA